MIRYIKNKDINKVKWDSCIKNSSLELIYNYSWYLDIVALDWDALIEGDYESVMPLPWRKKFGIQYIYTPLFVQQLGISTTKESVNVELFLKSIPHQFKFIELNLNEENTISNLKTSSISKHNYKLNIEKEYSDIRKGYNRNCKRNISKAERCKFFVSNEVSASKFRKFVFDSLEEQLNGVSNKDFDILEQLVNEVIRREKGEIVGLFDSRKELHAVGFYMFSKDRLIFSVCASSLYGKANQAMSKLVDSQIQKYAKKFYWYDFSGSNDKGIAYFNSTFGAEPETYLAVTFNRLPGILKFLKK